MFMLSAIFEDIRSFLKEGVEVCVCGFFFPLPLKYTSHANASYLEQSSDFE